MHVKSILIYQHAVIIAYDILLCFDRELASIWQRQKSFVTVLYAVQRYVTLVDFAMVLAHPSSLAVCMNSY